MTAIESPLVKRVNELSGLVKYFGTEKALLFDPSKGRAQLSIESPQGNRYDILIESVSGCEPVITSMGYRFPLTLEGLASCIFLLADRKRTVYQECVAYLRQ